MRHRGATRNPRRARHRRRKNRYRPPPTSPTDDVILPFPDALRPLYTDDSRERCGGFAVGIMCAIHYQRFVDPHPVYERALVLQPPGPATSPWANLTAAKEQGLISDFKWFKDVDSARAAITSGLAFIVLANAHIFCVRGFSDDTQRFYVTDDTGSDRDWAMSYASFREWMSPSWAICGVGLF